LIKHHCGETELLLLSLLLVYGHDLFLPEALLEPLIEHDVLEHLR
jgi:hypothetical protein